jgi:urease accessory protein
MNTDYEFHLMQLSDSIFPSGMFSMSGGLESFVNLNKICNSGDIQKFIKEQIEFQIIPCDCAVLSIAINGVKNNDLEKIVEIDNKYYSMKLAKEVRNSSIRSGKQVFNCLKYIIQDFKNKNEFINEFEKKIELKETPCTYPVALAITSVYFKIPVQSALRILLYSFCSSVVSAAIRLGIIQHLDAQKILMLLSETINSIISKMNYEKSVNDIWQLTPLTEIYQMKHEHYESRMFIT